jgi:hypothetical protein
VILTDGEVIGIAETADEPLTFDVSDEALERAANIIGGNATPVTIVFPPCGTVLPSDCPS